MSVSYRYDGTLSKDDQLQLLYEALVGTPDMIASVIDRLDLTITQEEGEEAIGDYYNLERCQVCEWWCEAGELSDEDGNVVPSRDVDRG